MKNFYERHELAFALIWIVIYVNVLSAADSLSAKLGTEKLMTFPAALLMSGALLLWLRRKGLFEKYGLCAPRAGARAFLFYLPLVLLCSCNAWFGLRLNMSGAETALYILSMLLVGVLEELIFRGLLFKAMCRDNIKTAIIVSSLSFGLGHIVNLFNGSGMDLVSNLCQICYAVAAGFMFVTIFHRGGSLIPCIAAHGMLNALSAFAVEPGCAGEIFSAAALCAISLGYTMYLNKSLPKTEKKANPCI